jgi:ribosomal protein S6--L-glutamate ligase
VCFLLERGTPPRRNPVIQETISLLERWGVTVRTQYAEEAVLRLDRLAVEADLYLLKSNTDLAFSLATALEAMGAHVLNTCAATWRARNKVLAAATLLGAGLPTPRSVAAGHPAQLRAEVAARRPLILKPHRGHYGLGIRVARTPAELPAAEDFADREVVFAQHYLAGARTTLKVCAIGDAVIGIRKPFVPGNSYAQGGEPWPLAPEVEELARCAGRAFGLELYGLDLAEGEDGAQWIVDVNAFPGYRGVPDAAYRLADHIRRRAGGFEPVGS